MRLKSIRLFPAFIVIVVLLSAVFGCGKQGSRYSNMAPTISITSYEGYNPDNPYTDSTEVTLFQQRIFWHGSDPDGVITGYAYRILNQEGTPVSTAGNDYIDSLGVITPTEVLNKFGSGWVLHYKEGSSHSLPLNDPEAQRTIWSTQKYATVNFLTADAFGDSITSVSRFEVICIDNRGEVCEQLAFRRFKSYSRVPVCFLSTTKGDPDGDQVGTGIRLSFTLNDSDPFIQPTAWYYKFKIQKIDESTDLVIPDSTSDMWFNTLGQPKLNEYKLTKYTTPHLSSDYNEVNSQVSYTRVIAKVVDLAGIESEADTIRFVVKEGFHPETLIHYKRVYALGNNHFIDYSDETTPEVLPYTIVNDKQIFATPFFRDMEGYYTTVHSTNLKIWLRWGWHGEYGRKTSSGATIITDDPYDTKIDELRDEVTDQNYYSEITFFDLRLDNEPYYYPPLAHSIVTDDSTGKQWLRVPVNSSLGQTIVLTNLAINDESNPYHSFEVRAGDLQDEIDPTPAEFLFKVVPPVSKEQKSGILIIDDDLPNANFAPNDSIDAKYANMVSSYTGQVVTRKRADMQYQDIRNRKFALSDIQNFKFIIYHDDYPTQTPNFPIEQDAFALYLNQGGNMLISAAGNLHGMVQAVEIATQRTLENYFGITYNLESTQIANITGSMLSGQWFVNAKSKVADYNDIPLAFDLNLTNPQPQDFYDNDQLIVTDPNESYLNFINTWKGLGPITLFNSYQTAPSSGVTPIFEYKSKPVYVQTPPITVNYYCPQNQADYDRVNGKTVGLKKSTLNNKCYILGFPLSYMKRAESKQFMTAVLNEIASQ